MVQKIIRRLVLAALLSIPWTLSAQAYDAELLALANKLVAQMEEAKLRSGTVLDFTDLQNTPSELGRFLAQELSNDLVTTSKQMSFVDRANLQTLLRENKLSVDGLVNPESSKKLGNLIGIDTIIFGTTTLMGDKIRLSVRAVAVETGRIVASQVATLPSTGGLAELSTRGVAAHSPSQGPSDAPKASDPRDRLRGDSIRVTGKEIVVVAEQYQPTWLNPTAFFVIENLSGMGFDAVLVEDSASIGGCRAHTSAGLAFANLQDQTMMQIRPPQWRYIPTGGKMNVTLSTRQCTTDPTLAEGRPSNIAAAMAIKIDGKFFSIPISASQIPVRASKSQ